MTDALNVGVIGLGFFGSLHARIYADHPAARLVGVCDRDVAALAATIAATGAKGFDDFRTLLARRAATAEPDDDPHVRST